MAVGFKVTWSQPGVGPQAYFCQQMVVTDPAARAVTLVPGEFSGNNKVITHDWILAIEGHNTNGPANAGQSLAQGVMRNIPEVGPGVNKAFNDMVKMLEDAATTIIERMHPVLALKVYMQLNALGHRMHSASYTFAHQVRELLRKKQEDAA